MAGLPDRDSLATYGGAMSNYSDPVDPTTDEDADYRNLYAMNVAMMTHTITRGARSFLGTTGGATGISDPTSGFVHDHLWGDASTVKPVGSYVQTGIYELAYNATVYDELNEVHTLNIRRAWAVVEQTDSTLRIANAVRMSAQRIRVYTYKANASGQMILDQLVGDTITVFFI